MILTFVRHWIGLMMPAFPGSVFRRCRTRLWRLVGFNVHPSCNITSTARLICWNIRIDEEAYIGEEVMITGGDIWIGARCDIAPRTTIHAGSHAIGASTRRAGRTFGGRIEIGDGTWIGTGATILSGAKIGNGSVVAAGSVVLAGEYPNNVLLAGVPAKVKKTLP